MFYSLNGIWQAKLSDGTDYQMSLPGTLDENRIGYKDIGANQWHPDEEIGNADETFDQNAAIATRFTRKYTYEGEAQLTRRISYNPPEGKRVFLEAERARCLKLLVDGYEIPDFIESSISTPHIFEITERLTGENELTLISDNSYPELPHDAIVYSSAATDETQTNWNGVLGYLRLRVEEPIFISAIRVYPRNNTLTVQVEVSANKPYKGEINIESEVLLEPVCMKVTLPAGTSNIMFDALPIVGNIHRWDEYEGHLYDLSACLMGQESKIVTFGVRDFGDNGKGRLAVNGSTIFLRSESNCAEFPETGYPPMTVKEWINILNIYKSYGINCMRFHSHCPPEAAFNAADQIGMLMQPELSHWNPNTAFLSDNSYSYYQRELKQIILWLANHPSFVMLAFGNELGTNEMGHDCMREMLKQAHILDSTRLYAEGSNVHYGMIDCEADSDFYTTQSYFSNELRGTFAGSNEAPGIRGYINNQYPNAMTNYDSTMENIRKYYQKPVFSFEVGQFEVLPDFDELALFKGISEPANLRLIQKKVEENGLLDIWKQYVEASGELSRIGYREEIEAAMRTEKISGISLLGLQDFPGQGTALVGMLNSHLEPKPFPFAKPEAFKAFFCDQLPLVLLPKYTYETDELLTADVTVANFGKHTLMSSIKYELTGNGISLTGTLAKKPYPIGELTIAGTLEIPLNTIEIASRLDLTVTIDDIINTYPIWVYPPVVPKCPDAVYETTIFDEKAESVLAAGGNVYLSPASTKENLPSSIQAQFTTDFWSVGTFSAQEGGMGQLIDASHPIFDDFPTESHTNWQWWPMASQRAIILPKQVKTIITEMDSYAYMRPMAQLLECRCGNGKLLLSSMGLQDLQQYPEARALLMSIYKYMDSDMFKPEQEIIPEIITSLVR